MGCAAEALTNHGAIERAEIERPELLGNVPAGSCDKIGSPAKAPTLPRRKPLRTKVGQTLSSVNSAISAIPSQLPVTGFPGHLLNVAYLLALAGQAGPITLP